MCFKITLAIYLVNPPLVHNIYQTIWYAIFDEEGLECRHEKNNKQDDFAIGAYYNAMCQDTLVGHTPLICQRFCTNFAVKAMMQSNCKESE